MFLVDIASYQTGIDLTKVKAAGFSAVNVKLTQGNWYTLSSAPSHVKTAQGLGMGISTFSWIDNSASGATQAAYAYKAMQACGGPDGFAHQVDTEDTTRPPTYAIWSDYVKWWQDKIGRHVVNYTGDWWWKPRGWDGASLTPYLWAPPNSGYLTTYPGDTSTAWVANFGGWANMSLLQYAVSPITGAGGGALSKTAIRDPAVWAALTGTHNEFATKDSKMLLLIHHNGQPYVCDGMTCRGPLTDKDVNDLKWLTSNGSATGLGPALGPLGNGGQFWPGDWTPAFGALPSDSTSVTLDNTQLPALAQAIVTGLVKAGITTGLTEAQLLDALGKLKLLVQ